MIAGKDLIVRKKGAGKVPSDLRSRQKILLVSGKVWTVAEKLEMCQNIALCQIYDGRRRVTKRYDGFLKIQTAFLDV